MQTVPCFFWGGKSLGNSSEAGSEVSQWPRWNDPLVLIVLLFTASYGLPKGCSCLEFWQGCGEGGGGEVFLLFVFLWCSCLVQFAVAVSGELSISKCSRVKCCPAALGWNNPPGKAVESAGDFGTIILTLQYLHLQFLNTRRCFWWFLQCVGKKKLVI